MPLRCLMLGTTLVLLRLPPLCAQPAPPDLLAPDGWHLAAPHRGDAALQETAAPGGAIETLTVSQPSQPFYLVQIIRGIPHAVPAGHVVKMHFEARSTTRNPMRVTVEQNGPPYAAVLALSPTLTPQWQAFDLTGVSPGYGLSGLSAHFQAGQQAGIIEVRRVSVTDSGLDPAQAEASAALPISFHITKTPFTTGMC